MTIEIVLVARCAALSGAPAPARDDDIDLHPDQLLGEVVEQLDIPFRGAVRDSDGLPIDPAQPAKTGEEG